MTRLIPLAALAVALTAGGTDARWRRAAPSCSGGQCSPAFAFPGAPALPAGAPVTCAGGRCELAAGPIAAAGTDALAEVNALRAARGLRPYLPDAQLAEGARRLAAARAAGLVFGHLANDFALVPGPAAATGCAAYPPSYGWMSCAVYDNYTYAGAAWVMGADGKRYMHLVLR